jgi:hypothetical protein
MKKLLALVTGLVAAGSAFASPVLSPAAAAAHTDGVFFCDDCACWSLRAGFRGDYVFNRNLTGTDGNGSHKIDRYSMFANEGVLTLNLWDRLDIYGLVGAASQSLDTNIADRHFTVNYETKTIWGVGARATILEGNWGCCGTSYLGADVNYEGISTANSSSRTLNGAPNYTTNSFGTTRYHEWGASIQVGHRIDLLTPYIAAKWSNAHVGINDLSASNKNRHWGWAVGTSLVDAGRMSVTAEARFIDETAMTINAEFRF